MIASISFQFVNVRKPLILTPVSLAMVRQLSVPLWEHLDAIESYRIRESVGALGCRSCRCNDPANVREWNAQVGGGPDLIVFAGNTCPTQHTAALHA